MGANLLWVLGALLFLFAQGGMVVTVRADAMVTGTVFCDQCRDGHRSLFDYPLSGAKVAVSCMGAEGVNAYKEESTNWFGGYAVRFKGRPDLNGCYARVLGGPPRCGAAAGPAQGLRLLFRMFSVVMYTVEPLLSQPPEPMSFCPHASTAPPPKPVYRLPPPVTRPPPMVAPFLPPPAHVSPPRQVPFLEPSACSYDKWLMPEYKCYWKVVGPDTKVALVFGPAGAGRYGADMTLWEGLQGRGDLYRTLLREGTAALLNSYNSLGFLYPTLNVIDRMESAMLGTYQEALMAAMRFKRANLGGSGPDKVGCNFSPCS